MRTLNDLAQLAGVSAGTVSRALAGSTLVKEKTRERIQALAREHAFHPNQIASKLRTRRTGVVGVVIPLGHERRQQISDPFFMRLLGCLADELTECGYDLMLSRAIPDDQPDWLGRITGSGMVDGVIVIGQSNQAQTIDQMAQNYAPMMVWGSHASGLKQCVVGTDNVAGGELAAGRLLKGGARKLAFLGDTTGIEIAQRLAGAESAALDGGASITHLPCPLSGDAMEITIRAQLADHADGIDGIVCASDMIAMTAMKVLRQMGKAIPGDIQIVGFDDLPLAAQTIPPLTTIRQDIARGAHALVAGVMAAIGGEKAQDLVMEPILVERETTR